MKKKGAVALNGHLLLPFNFLCDLFLPSWIGLTVRVYELQVEWIVQISIFLYFFNTHYHKFTNNAKV